MTDKKLEVLQVEGVQVKKSCCYFCHQNCGVLAYVKDGKVLYAEGDPNHPTNQGGLCARGNQAMTFLDNPSRVNYPLKRAGKKGENKWERVTWDQALTEIAAKLNQIKEESGAEAVAACAGTLRTDDWARRRFLNAFGTPNGFHNALLCWIPTFMVETALSGWSPFETDLGGSKCVIMWGFNPGAASMPGAHGYFDLQTMTGIKLIVVDPRYSETAAHADLWLPLRPGSDTALSLAMINVIINERLYDQNFVATWCEGFEELSEHIQQYSPEWAAEETWLTPDQIREAARMYATNTPGNIQWGCTWDQLGKTAGAGMHARAILRAICGNLDVPGGDGMPGPAAYITDEELECNYLLPDEVKERQIGADKYKMTTWPGYGRLAEISKERWGKAFTAEWMCEAHGPSVFKAILTGVPYQVRALFVSGSNPLSSYGDAKMTYAAIKQVEFLVVLDYFITPTALQADFILPVAGAMERPVIHTNYGVTDSVVGNQRAIEPMYERMTDFNIWRAIGLACGQSEEIWPYERLEDEFMHVLSPLNLPISSYDDFVERFRMYYPPLQQAKHLKRGYFCTASGKVELKVSVFEEFGLPGLPTYLGPTENEKDDPEVAEEYPLVLTTGGGFMPFHHSEHFNNPIIRYIKPEPFFTINPKTAEKLNISEGDWCWIETRRGRIKQRANVEPGLDPRVIYTQRGWWFPERTHEGDQPFGCFESNTNVLTTVDDEHCDPLTGCWGNRGLLCKVYKCTELDCEYTHEDTLYSIPGSAKEAGIDWEYVKNPPRALPFRMKRFAQPDFQVPAGMTWDYKTRKAWDANGRFYEPQTGFVVDPETNVYYHRATGYAWFPYGEDQNFLMDEKTGQFYDFDDPTKKSKGPQPDRPVPAGFKWDPLTQTLIDPKSGFRYDEESGWLIDDETGLFYERTTLRAFDPITNLLVDMNTGKYYSFDDPNQEVPAPTPEEYAAAEAKVEQDKLAEQAASMPPRTKPVPAGFKWDALTQTVRHPETNFILDEDSGWLIDPDTNVYYEKSTLRAWDASANVLIDMQTGKYYSVDDPNQEVADPYAVAEGQEA